MSWFRFRFRLKLRFKLKLRLRGRFVWRLYSIKSKLLLKLKDIYLHLYLDKNLAYGMILQAVFNFF